MKYLIAFAAFVVLSAACLQPAEAGGCGRRGACLDGHRAARVWRTVTRADHRETRRDCSRGACEAK
jgi:hypothetical protein